MKRSERHHLKENAFAVAMASLGAQLSDWGRLLAVGVSIGTALLLLYAGYDFWTDRNSGRAGVLLAEALVVADAPVVPPPPPGAVEGEEAESAPLPPFVQPPGTYPSLEAKMNEALPRLLDAANAYPSSQPGITARYRAAAALANLGRHDEAAAEYREVIDQDAGLYARMAALGLADVELARGSAAAAIELLESASGTEAAAQLPLDGVLMRLATAYDRAGRTGDARATYQRVLDEFPTSPYLGSAERELEALSNDG